MDQTVPSAELSEFWQNHLQPCRALLKLLLSDVLWEFWNRFHLVRDGAVVNRTTVNDVSVFRTDNSRTVF